MDPRADREQAPPTMLTRLQELASRAGAAAADASLDRLVGGAGGVVRAERASLSPDADPEYRAVVEWLDDQVQGMFGDLGRRVADMIEERAIAELERVRRERATRLGVGGHAQLLGDEERLARFDPEWSPADAIGALAGLSSEGARLLLVRALDRSDAAARSSLYLAWVAAGLGARGGLALPRADLVERLRAVLGPDEAREVLRLGLVHRSPAVRARAAHLSDGLE
jgi:hypothetical protein